MTGRDDYMKAKLWPQSRSGQWSAGLSIAFIVLIMLKMMGALPFPTFAVAALGLAGFIAGIAAIIGKKERAILVFLPILVGLLIISWTVAEIVYPH